MIPFESLAPLLTLLLGVLIALRSRARRRASRAGTGSVVPRRDPVARAADTAERAHRRFSLVQAMVVLAVVAFLASTSGLAAWILGGTATLLAVLYLAARRRPRDPHPRIDDPAIRPR